MRRAVFLVSTVMTLATIACGSDADAPSVPADDISTPNPDPDPDPNPGPDPVLPVATGFECPDGQRPNLDAIDLAELSQDLTEVRPDAIECVDEDDCGERSCGDSGRCVVSGGQALCRCDPGYAGVACSECAWGFQRVDGRCQLPKECDQSVCSGFGRCEVSGDGRISCACSEGIGGEYCERCADGFHNTVSGCVRSTRCDDEDCSGNGTCAQEGMRAVCTCDAGWAGADCSDPCDATSCNGRGTCRPDAAGEASCICDTGFDAEDRCGSCAPGFEVDVAGGCSRDSVCDSDTCGGRGDCSDAAGGPICTCRTGFTGDSCERCADGYVEAGDGCQLRESCDLNSCSGNGACEDSSGFAVCTCTEGYSGENCDIFVAPTRVLRGRVPESVTFGDSAVLQLTVNGIGNFSQNLRYELTSGPGRLVLDPQGGPPRYEAPADDGSSVLGPAVITVTPIPPGPLGPAPFPGPGLSLTIPVIPPDAIPASGLGWAGTEPLDNAVRDFMRYRCVGAAALTVMRNGTVIYRKGFGRMDGPASVAKFPGCGTDAEDPHRSGSGVLTSHTPFGLGSLSKAIAAATLRWLVRARMEQIGRSGDVEDQMLLDPELNLLPADVRNVLNGTASPYALEVPFMDPAPNRSSDCDSEGTSAWNGTDCLCNFGYSGQRCSYNNVACAGTNANQPGAVPTSADTRWQDMTIGHLLSHRAGLPRDFSNTTFLLPNLAVIRGLSTEADWQGQQDALASGLEPRGLDDDLLAAQSTLDSEGIENPYFVPWVLPGDNPIDELLTAYGSACLQSRPGQVYAYSNWGYVIIGRIIERLHGSNRYTALLGQPDTHPGSALAQFLASEFSLGNGLGSDYGIYADPQSVGVSLFTPAKRLWTASPASYYDPQTDRKWPVCSWNGTTCSFSDWRNSNNNVRFNGEWTRDPVPPWQARSGVWNNGWAGIAAELPLYARFMNRFWISGYNQWASEDNADPFIGEERLVGDSRRTAHTGLVTGARAVAEYLGAARDWTLTLPPVVGGRIVDDESNTGFRNASDYPPDGSSETCSLPSGLTYVFAVNNSSDRRCIPEPGEDSGNAAVCSREYALMDDFIKFGLCQSDLNNVGYPPLTSITP